MARIRRLAFGEIDPRLQTALQSRVNRLGYLGEFFAVAAHQPSALLAFNDFTESLKDALPAEIVQVVALAVAAATGNEYERCQHEQLATRLGFSDDWIAAAIGAGSDQPLSGCAKSVRNLAVAMNADHGRNTEAQLAAVREETDEATTVGVLLLIGRYLAHAAVSNALEFCSPVPPVLTKPVAS